MFPSNKNDAKAAELVMSAIAILQEGKDSTLTKITRFITSRYDVDEQDIKQPVKTALRRGVMFGFLKKQGSVYKLSVTHEKPSTQSSKRKPSKTVKRAGKRKPRGYSRRRSHSRSRENGQRY